MTFGAVGGTLAGGGGGSSISGLWQPLHDDGISPAASSRSTVTATASGTPHTKGAWVEIEASLSEEAHLVFIELAATTSTNGVATSTLLDIGVGAAASEVVKVANLPIGYAVAGHRLVVPVTIPAGSRVAVRVQSAVASKTVECYYGFADLNVTSKPAASLVTMGADTATSKGVSVAYPGSLNTKGSWVEIEDSTPADFEALIIGIQADGDTGLDAANSLIDIGIGAAAAETVLFNNVYVLSATSDNYSPKLLHTTRSAEIPAGSRLSARWQTSAANNSLDIILIGVPVQ